LFTKNPAFGPAQIRELTPIFTEKANQVLLFALQMPNRSRPLSHPQLRDIWRAEIAKQEERTPIDILPWLSRLTLDVIGLAGLLLASRGLPVQQCDCPAQDFTTSLMP
jgi:hypothetical protein